MDNLRERIKREVMQEMFKKFEEMSGINWETIQRGVHLAQSEQLRREVSEAMEKPEKEIDPKNLEEMNKPLPKDKVKRLQRRLKDTKTNGGFEREHSIIDEKDLIKHLDEGWKIVTQLNSGKLVVRKGREKASILGV